MELVKDPESMEPYPELGRALKKTALKNGLIMRIDPSWFALAPALIASKEDIDQLVELVDSSLKAALEEVA